MTQRIENLYRERLMDVCLNRLKAWPESWGKYVVAANASGSDKALWFGDELPRRYPGGGWSGVGTVEIFLNVLPIDQRDAVVSRDHWLKHSRYNLLNMLVDTMPEWGEDCGEFAVWNDGVDPAHQGKPGAVLFCNSKPSDPLRDSLDKQTDAVWTFQGNDMPVDRHTAVVTRSQWLEGALKRQDKHVEAEETDAWAAEQSRKFPAYWRPIPASWRYIDTYRINELFPVDDDSGAVLHARKKLLVCGTRTGGKAPATDLREAVSTLECKLNNMA